MKINKSNNNKCLRLGKCSFYYIYILFTCILFLFKNSLLSLQELDIKKDYNLFGINTILYKYGLIKLVIEHLGYILYSFIFILIKKKCKKEKKFEEKDLNINEIKGNESVNSKTQSNDIELIYNDNDISNVLSINLLIAGGIFAIQLTIKNILLILKVGMLDLWVFNIVFISIFLKKIFKYKIYKLHIYIFIFNSVTNFILFVFASWIKNDNNQSDYTYVKNNYGSYIYIFLFYISFI